ncbi:MAG TPA: 50S ribosomal protein L7/L12 [Planctomycetota bacterium]|nr:50S ribosomal protein L7/L12 [Planctomycetota bacterium]
MSKFDQFLADVDGCTVMELAELVSALEKKWGVSAAAAAAAPAGGGGGAAAAADAEPTAFKVTLLDGGANKIQAIKVIRALTGLGLADAKAFVEGAPKVVKEGLEKPAADDIKKQLEDIGAKVEVKGV